MKKVLGFLFIIIGLVCIGGSFLLPKEEETTVKKEDKKEEEKLTPPEEKNDDQGNEEPVEYIDFYEKYKFENFYGIEDELLTPGTYTIDNLSDWMKSYFLEPDFQPLGKCSDGSTTNYITEENLKAEYEKTFGEGTYKRFDLRYVCMPYEFNEDTKRYEKQCLTDPCGYEMDSDYHTAKLDEKRVGDTTVLIEKVEKVDYDNTIIATYNLTYTLRTKDGVFISLKVEEK